MPDTTPLSTLSFRLLIAGNAADAQLTEKLAPLQLKPKHVALLSALALGAPGSQQDLAAILNIAPSLVVSFADHLEALGAIVRQRDVSDRRRQHLVLTTEGRRLLGESLRISQRIDDALRTGLSSADQTAVGDFLNSIVSSSGVPVDGPAPKALDTRG